MSWRTSWLLLRARSVARLLGVNRLIAKCIGEKDYEARYQAAFSEQLRAGDRIWDVGANIGHYTRQFAEAAGSAGHVYAFEPSPQNFQQLSDNCADCANVTLFQFGLGAHESTVGFQQGADAKGATSRIVEPTSDGPTITIRAGSEIITDGTAPAPTILKIDVEGFEWDVIQGLGEQINNPDLRMLGIEVHFRILEELGKSDVPSRIESCLKSAGFRLVWSDPSHLLGIR